MQDVATFPFTKIGQTKLGVIYRPYAIVQVYSKVRQKWQPLEMIIDTGADYTLLPNRYASILGIDLEKDCFVETTLGVGGSDTVYLYKGLEIKLGEFTKRIPVGFLERSDVPALLGRLSCLEDFKLVMDSKVSKLSLR